MNLLKISLLVLAVCTSLAAAEPPPRVFRVVTTVGSIGELMFDRTSRDTVRLNIRSRLSRPIEIPSSGALDLYRELPPPPDSPAGTKPTKETVATLSFPASLTKAIVVIAQNGNGSGYRAVVFSDDIRDHPAGTLRVFNLSRMNSAVKINQSVGTIEAGNTKIMPYPPGPADIQLAVQRGAGWNVAFDKGRISHPNLRAHVFVFDYQKDPEIDDLGPPPPALVRFFTESVPQELAQR